MMNSSSCMKRYENYQTATHHSRSLSSNYPNNFTLQQNSSEPKFDYTNANDWTGYPLIKFADSTPFRRINFNSYHETKTNNYNKNVRKVNHVATVLNPPHVGYQNIKQSSLNDENLMIDKIENFVTKNPHDNNEVHIALNHGNGTFLPRIIKPRKRRKKDRKPTNNLQQTVENASTTFPFTFSSTTNEKMQNLSNKNVDCVMNENNNNNNNNYSHNRRSSKPTKCDANFYFNNTILNSNLSTSNVVSSSPISLSNSSLSSSNNSSCSCRLCDPNCKIWSFPLRRSFSDNSTGKMESSNDTSSIENGFIENSAKDVGVIGSNRSKSEGKSCTKSLLTLMDIFELEHNQQHLPNNGIDLFSKNLNHNILDRSICNIVLNNLRISDDFLSTANAVNEDYSNNDLNIITQQLSGFNLLCDNHVNPKITEQNNRIISSNTSASLVKFENFIEMPLKKQDQSNFFSQNLFAHNLMKNGESSNNCNNILGTNHNSLNDFDVNSKCSELLYSNLLGKDVSEFPSQFKNRVENLSLFI